MRATPIFVAFFLLFTTASIAVPIPMFPGNIIASIIEFPISDYILYLEATTNGLTYAFITCLIFFIINKKLEKTMTLTTKK
ncbi:MAG: hypothetical protein CW691_04700 [Candidatus Bathyarchaeum sp.]|nr:MAG: hypothetical protein CW691_04700 [Candidatus Bathyarchaeum sp.]